MNLMKKAWNRNRDSKLFVFYLYASGRSKITPPQPVRERPFWGVSHRVEPLSRLHLSPFKGIYFFILKFCFMLNNSS